jgi:hypothetical protein
LPFVDEKHTLLWAGALSHLDFGVVIPAQAGIQIVALVSRLRENDCGP